MALNFNQYASEAHTFLKDYAIQLGMEKNTEKAGRILTSVLHALREIIPTEESLQFIAQLPMFLKALYVNGWSIKKKKPRVKHMADLVALVKDMDGAAAINDYGYEEDLAEKYIELTFIYFRKYVSQGEMEDIRDHLPKDLKSLIQSHLSF